MQPDADSASSGEGDAPRAAAQGSGSDLPTIDDDQEVVEEAAGDEAQAPDANNDPAPVRPFSELADAMAGEKAEPLPEGEKPEPLERVARPSPPVDASALPSVDELDDVEEVDLASMPDEDLMKLCQEGDELAFEQLFKRYEGPALSFIFRMIGDRGRTEAIGQEAFMRIFKDATSYQYPRSFATWFYTIVRNLCKNELRWRSRHPSVSIEENLDRSAGRDEGGLHLGDNLRAKSKDPLERMVGDEMVSKLSEALKSLPELEREILILNRFQGLKYREIAEVVGLPVGTVRSRIHSALERLRRAIKEYL